MSAPAHRLSRELLEGLNGRMKQALEQIGNDGAEGYSEEGCSWCWSCGPESGYAEVRKLGRDHLGACPIGKALAEIRKREPHPLDPEREAHVPGFHRRAASLLAAQETSVANALKRAWDDGRRFERREANARRGEENDRVRKLVAALDAATDLVSVAPDADDYGPEYAKAHDAYVTALGPVTRFYVTLQRELAASTLTAKPEPVEAPPAVLVAVASAVAETVSTPEQAIALFGEGSVLGEGLAEALSPGGRLAESAPPAVVRVPVCANCNDTHRVPAPDGQGGPFGDGMWMCTSCPTPCRVCAASEGRGAFCARTPCSCGCHRGRT